MSELDEEWKRQVGALGPEPEEEALGGLAGAMVHQATSAGRVAVATFAERPELGRRLLAQLDFAGLLGAA